MNFVPGTRVSLICETCKKPRKRLDDIGRIACGCIDASWIRLDFVDPEPRLICGSEFAFGECKWASVTHMCCGASRGIHFACEYHDNGDVARELRRRAALNIQERAGEK